MKTIVLDWFLVLAVWLIFAFVRLVELVKRENYG